MDEIHAVLELFVSCRGSGWPLVRLEAEQQLLTQHLLMAAPMDKEEIEDLIKQCFEADNNGEINFLSFWSGMENLLELLGIREPSAHVDDKVYGLQVFRDGLLAEAMSKHQGPTSSVLLSRDEVLRIIDQTNKSVASRHSKGRAESTRCDGGSYQGGDASSSSLFWDEVYRETALLDSTSVLSVTELSMMVFGFLKSYLRQESTAVKMSEGVPNDVAQQVHEQAVPSDTSGVISAVSGTSCVPEAAPVADTAIGAAHPVVSTQELRSQVPGSPDETGENLDDICGSTMMHKGWQKGWELEHPREHRQDRAESRNDFPSVASPSSDGHVRGSERQTYREASDSPVADVSHILTRLDSEDPFLQLRHLLIFSGDVVERGVLSKKDMQQLRHLNAAAVDCVDRMSAERDKRNEEANEAVLSLRRMRTEKQQLIERLATVEHQHSQLQLQQEQQLCERDRVDQLQESLASERVERERLQALLRDKEEDLTGVIREKDALLGKISSQKDDLNRLLEAVHKEKAALSEDLRKRTEILIREKEALEEKLRSAEDKARAAEAARQQLQGDAHLSTSTLRQRILELEEDKQRQETEAEENDALILQLQGRLEEKVQQVTILEVKNKQQARLLQQVRGVRNSLMQVLQDSKENEPDKGGSTGVSAAITRDAEIMKLKAGMKAALAHIKELETFIDEMRKEQRRGAHPRYEISAASGDSFARSLERQQTSDACNRPLRALRTLGDELEMSEAASNQEVSCTGIDEGNSKASENAPSEGHDASTHCEESRIACKGSGGTTGIATSEAGSGEPVSKQPSIREQIVTVEKQKLASSKVVGADVCGLRRHRQAHAGTSGNVGSFASLRSEPSTIDAASKEPTSSASLPEAEEIFDPLDMLKSEDSMETEAKERSAVKGRLSVTSHAAQRIHPSGRTRQPSPKNGMLAVHASSASAVSSDPSELPPGGGSPKMSCGHSASSSGLELPLEGRRCRSRATDSNASSDQRNCTIESSVVLPSQELGSASRDRGRSTSREKNFLSDSLASTSSDGKFLMLTALGEAKKSPTASTSRRVDDRSPSSKVELAARALDSSTLSSMFSMLGSCAALPGNATRRAAAPTDADDTTRNTRGGGGEDSSKTKHKQPGRLSAAATAAISAKDASEFRSLRRVSQGSAHRIDPPEDSPGHIDTRRMLGSTQVGELTAHRREPTSDECPLTGRDQWTSTQRPSPSPKAGHARARRTVSLGRTETPGEVQGRDVVDQQKRLPSLTTPVSSEGDIEHPGVKENYLQDSEAPQKASMTVGSASEGRSGADMEKDLALESGSPASSLRKTSGVLNNALGTVETCRSRGNANTHRSPRSRSSSSEPPSRKVTSAHGPSTSRQTHAPKSPHETRHTEASGERQVPHASSRAYEGTECETEAETMRRQVPVVADQTPQQDRSGACKVVGLRTGSTSEDRRSDDQLRSTQRLQNELKKGCAKIQDEQTASAAALLAAAAGVVDASLQQQQQMIQRQQEHHEDLQRAQQRRIDMLQEQLEHLQKTKEEQRESGEQEQKKLIHTLQAKLEELQKRQDQREQDFQEAQRKLQEDLEMQVKKKLEELRCSPLKTNNKEAASSCSTGQSSLRVSYSHRQDTDIRTSHTLKTGYQHAASGESDSFERIAGEQALHSPAQYDNGQKPVSDVHPFTAMPEDFGTLNTKHVNQLLSSGKTDSDTLNCTAWHRGGAEPQGCTGRIDLHNAGAGARGQPAAAAAGGYVGGPHDQCSDSDASSCASSSLMGSQCGLPAHGCSFEDVPTTTSSSFISQSTTPAVCSSMPSQRGNYLAGEAPVERQIYASGGDRPLAQSTDVHRRESVLRRHNLLRPQASECSPCASQHVPVNACQADPPFTSAASASRPLSDSSTNINTGATTSSVGCKGGSQEKLLRGDLCYRSGNSHQPSGQDSRHRESGTGLVRPQPSVYHPVSRAERVITMQQAHIDSARFLGSSNISEKVPCLSGLPRGQQGAFSSRESQLPAPLASARESISADQLEGNEATPMLYRCASTSAALTDAELSRYPTNHRQKTHRGSSRKDKMDDKRQLDESRNAEMSAAGESSSSTAPSSGWAGFNGGFMSQVQKWIG
ncbi:uncharacterized protein EMH_0040910 [Eimeria mitis]|uniref:Proteophosphoglycan 5, related n=1 Tax=Eimeria mitis TaxID=44415 RepID=U6KL84_9EIME|nr:uncharacterized protein EMH_0040910 [Eimeria mitis]CDJ36218.1 hypothetical protein, conserved [Eimeria mitis]